MSGYIKKRALSALIASLMLSSVPLSALTYTGIGEVYDVKRDTVGDGLRYSELTSVTSEGKNQRSYIFEYKPSGDTLPLVRCGGGVYGTNKLGTIVSSAENEGSTVLGALNGDFYSMQTGVPLGIMIDSGELVSSDDSKYAFAVTNDGEAIIGKPAITISMTDITSGETAIPINHFNKYPSVWGAYLLDENFSQTTHSTIASTEIVIEINEAFRLGETVTGKVREIKKGTKNSKIPQGCAILVIAESSTRYSEFENIKVGDELRFDIDCSEGWDNVMTAVGGGDLILENGTMPEGIIDDAHEKTNNPRTAVGIREDGTAVFFAVDGRSSSSYGLTETQLSALMSELGCVTALNLDGGGSTTVMVKASDTEDCVYVNVPSDGVIRSISNGILFISKYASDGTAAALSPKPNTPYVLTGSKVNFEATVLDRAYMPTEITLGSDELILSFAEDYGETFGSVSGGSYTAGSEPGEVRLIATSADLSGEVSVIVTDKIDTINVTPSYSKAKSGTLVKLDITGSYKDKSIICSPSSMYYTLNGTHKEANQESYPGAMLVCDLGFLDFDGNFQSFGGREGVVEIGVVYGDITKTVTINVGTGPDYVSDFEDVTDYFGYALSTDGGTVYLSPGVSGFASNHAYGMGAEYSSAVNRNVFELSLIKPFPISPNAKFVKLWLRGGEDCSFTAELRDDGGKLHTVAYQTSTDYSDTVGWRELVAAVPKEGTTGTLYIEKLLKLTVSGSASHELAIDRIYVSYGDDPQTVIEDVENHWAKDNIYTLYNMGVIRLEDCTVTDTVVTYQPDKTLTRGDFAKMLAIFRGMDITPYIYGGAELEAETPEDKIPYIRAVLDAKLMSGRGAEDGGAVIFDANASITREEACKVLGSLISSDLSELEFTDANTISDWAQEGMSKCAAAGIISGYDDGTVRPKETVTRAEFATMLSRMG